MKQERTRRRPPKKKSNKSLDAIHTPGTGLKQLRSLRQSAQLVINQQLGRGQG